jgi:recombination associated protein RdgC
MGALKGSISVRRYAVLDPLPADPRQKMTRGIRSHAFLPLDPAAEPDRSIGWVSILDSADADLRADKLFFVAPGGEHLRLALRIDVLKPPTSEVRRQLQSKLAAHEAEHGRPATRREKGLFKDEIVRLLRKRAFPRVRVTDVVWDLDQRRLYFWSQSKSTNEAFVDLFVKSFGLRLEIEGSARWTRAAVDDKALAQLEPTPELWLGFSGLRPLATDVKEDDR